MSDAPTRSRRRSRHWNWLLAVPFVALLWVPFYNAVEPTLWGVPFFYWYQFAWLIITALLIVLLYHLNVPISRRQGEP